MKLAAVIFLSMLAVAVVQGADDTTVPTEETSPTTNPGAAATSTTEGQTTKGVTGTDTNPTVSTQETTTSGAASTVVPISVLLTTGLLTFRRLC